MKRALLLVAAISFAVSGCHAYQHKLSPGSCKTCGPNQADNVPRLPIRQRGMEGPSGPATGAVAYPYYTTRGPRDFFMDAPDSIGP